MEQEKLNQLKLQAEQGGIEAQCELATCYLNGYGVEKDLEKHIYWLRLSAELDCVASYKMMKGNCIGLRDLLIRVIFMRYIS